jgi:hypothetical protein
MQVAHHTGPEGDQRHKNADDRTRERLVTDHPGAHGRKHLFAIGGIEQLRLAKWPIATPATLTSPVMADVMTGVRAGLTMNKAIPLLGAGIRPRETRLVTALLIAVAGRDPYLVEAENGGCQYDHPRSGHPAPRARPGIAVLVKGGQGITKVGATLWFPPGNPAGNYSG